MKSFRVVAILMSLFAVKAFAGTSSEDPKIAELRGRFASASIPSSSGDEALGSWICTVFSSRAGSSHIGNNMPLNLEAGTDGFVHDSDATFTAQPVGFVTGFKPAAARMPQGPMYAGVKLGYILAQADQSDFVEHMVIRVEDGKGLIAELVKEGVTPEGKSTIASSREDAGVSFPDMKAQAYFTCTH